MRRVASGRSRAAKSALGLRLLLDLAVLEDQRALLETAEGLGLRTGIKRKPCYELCASPNEAPMVMFTPDKYWSEWKEVKSCRGASIAVG